MVTVPASAGDAASLVGREREVGELRLLTAGRRLVTLCGAGGIGKTSLLRALMAAIRPDYPDGAFLVLLRDLRQPELVLAQVARALRIAQEPGIPLADTLAAALAGRRLLLALDGVEHVAAACAQLCARLMAGAPGVQIVAAGREPLRVPGETIWQVPPLLLPGPGTSDPGTAIRSDAAALFALRAAAAAPGFVLDQGTCAAVTDICRSVGGVPLAVELAAARLRDQDVTRLARQLAALPGLPGPGEHAVPVPHAAMMRSVVGCSSKPSRSSALLPVCTIGSTTK